MCQMKTLATLHEIEASLISSKRAIMIIGMGIKQQNILKCVACWVICSCF